MKLYLIRHAQSTNNTLVDQRERVADPDLTELGYRQAQILAEYLTNGKNPELFVGNSAEATVTQQQHGYGLTRLYCSPMWRALLTAELAGQALGIAPTVWTDIHEVGGIYMDYGEAGGLKGHPGKTRSEILERFPDYILPEEISEAGWWHGTREDWPFCQGRAIRVARQLREMAKESDGTEQVALISHGGFMDALVKALLNQLPGTHVFYHHFNTAITHLDFHENGHLNLRYMNRIDHLSLEMIS